jgi:hypothetical protein
MHRSLLYEVDHILYENQLVSAYSTKSGVSHT